MLGHHPVHGVGEHDVGLSGGQPGLDQFLEQRARIDRGADRAVARRLQVKRRAFAHRRHEIVGDQHTMVQVQRLAVEIARGLADFEELLDLGVADVEIAGGRTTPQRALRNRQRQAVHHADKRDDPAGLAVEPNRLADPADIAPIGADPAALGGEPDVLVPGADDPFEAVLDRIEVARNRQTAVGAAVRQHRSGRHEPQLGNVVIKALGMRLVIGIGIRHAGEQILIGFAGQEVTVGQGFLAEIGQQRIADGVGADQEAAVVNLLAVNHGVLGGFGHRATHGIGQHFTRLGGDQRVGTGIGRLHGHSPFVSLGLFIPCGQRIRRTGIQLVRHITRHVVARLEIHLKPHFVAESSLWHKTPCSYSVLYRPVHRLANSQPPVGACWRVG